MKTIRLLFSVAVFAVLTLFFANLKPPSPQTTHVEAVKSVQKIETVNTASLTEKPAEGTNPAAAQVKETPAPTPTPAPQPTTHEELMQAAGISQADFSAADDIVAKESGWCATKWEGEHACNDFHGVPDGIGYGLCQATPGFKMASADPDWATNAVKQLKWCDNYVQAYGGWWPAKKFRDCLGSCYSPRTNSTVYKKTTWF